MKHNPAGAVQPTGKKEKPQDRDRYPTASLRASPREVTTQVSTAATFASAKQALDMLQSAMSYLAAADPTQMAAETQAQCLQALERADAMGTAARASILGAFTAGRAYCADADYSPRAWLVHRTRVTKGAAAGHTGWARRAAAHPPVHGALASRGPPRSSAL